MTEDYLQSIYFNPKHPAAFAGFNKLYKFVKQDDKFKISKKILKDWLGKQESYTSHQPVISKFKRPKVIVGKKDRQWDGDTANMLKYEKDNDGYKYFALFIDIFTRFVWTYPLKTLKGKEMVEAMTKIFLDAKSRKLRTDRGSEFVNRDVKKFLRIQSVDHFTTTNETKANFAERAIKTIKKRLVRYMDYKQSFKWVDVLGDITESYNQTYHRSIKMTPTKARDTKPTILWHIQYDPKLKPVKKEKKLPKYKTKFSFKIGDRVKLSHLRNLFDREYDQKWTTEVFTILDRSMQQGIPLYTIKDYNNDPIEGKFYAKELQKVTLDENTLYKVENIVRRRKNEVLVKWLGWPKKFNSWIPKSEVQDYK